MDSLNDLYSRHDRLAPLPPDPLELASKRILTDAWPFAFILAAVLMLGFAMGYQAGFRDGAEQQALTNSNQKSEGQNR